jgi:heme/copper-type cytochrome/quinol oxidase subunit 1
MNVYKISKIVVIIIGIIASILFVSTLGMEISMENNSYIVDYFIYVSYLAMAIAFFSVIYFVFKNLFTHKDQLKRALISLGLFAAIILVAFILADSTEVKLKDGGVISSFSSKLISTSLNTFYILAIISVGVLGWTGFSKIKR